MKVSSYSFTTVNVGRHCALNKDASNYNRHTDRHKGSWSPSKIAVLPAQRQGYHRAPLDSLLPGSYALLLGYNLNQTDDKIFTNHEKFQFFKSKHKQQQQHNVNIFQPMW